LLEGVPAIGVGLLDHGPECGVVHEVEAVRSWRLRRCGNYRTLVLLRERGNRLLEDVEESFDDINR
jgi:hypothetical protein